MNYGIVILSRFNSSRLPGKALKQIEGKPVLKYILERLGTAVPLENIVVATSDEMSDDPIAEFCQKEQVACFRGSLKNVSERFLTAAQSKGWDYAVRINGDNIFLDTDVLDKMLKLAAQKEAGLVSNVKGRTFPKGMSVEIVKTSHYAKQMQEINKDERYREHVTLYLYEHESSDLHYIHFKNDALPEAAGIQLALDTEEDFQRSKDLIKRFERSHIHYNLKEILQLIKN